MKEEKRTKRKYSQEFKDDAVKLVAELGSVNKAAQRLGVTNQSLSNWAKKAESEKYSTRDELVEALQSEVKQLRKERDEARKINEVLKKATAFFSQDQSK